jgi:uridine kinase
VAKQDAGGITPAEPRTTAQVKLPDGRVFEAPLNTAVGDVLRAACGEPARPLMAAIVNGRLRELTFPLGADADVTPLDASTSDGVRVYRRSLAFLMLVAFEEVFPGAEIFIEHSATTAAGYYCEVHGRAHFTQAELRQVQHRMQEIVEEDAPIVREIVPRQEAIDVYLSRGETDKARLLAHRDRDTLTLYKLHARRDYFQGYMVPSTGHLMHFALHALPTGFMLQFPHQDRPTEIGAIKPYPKLFAVFEQASDWLDRLGIRSASALNDAIVGDRLREVSLVAEALHEAGIATIASNVAGSGGRIRVVFIAGPSSSGKTTFSKRLAVQLLANGIRPMPLGLDDYFVDRDQTPRDAKGEYDYETVRALDIGLFNEHLRSLIEGRPTALPHYNFVSGLREQGQMVTLGPSHVIIVEGIHGLNPALVQGLPPEWIFRIYVSALTQLNLDRHNRVATSDSRLIRRVVRDAATRGYSASATLHRWESVIRSEKQHIFRFQENADAVFNSALVHEVSVLRPFVEPLLLQVRPEAPEYVESNRLLSFLTWFRPAQPDHVPDNSILREFIGGSILSNLRLWPDPPA